MNGWDMALLRQRIGSAGYSTHQFSYNSTSTDIEQVVEELKIFVVKIDAEYVHYVCHSLGGLVVRHFLDAHNDLPHGRIVTLGTPHNGSSTAHLLNSNSFTSMILGESMNAGLLGNAPAWTGELEIGVIAGDVSLGMGKLFQGMDEPNDGTVSVEETLLENRTDHIKLPVSHTGLMLSKTVADETVNFLKQGKFTKN